jgi:hypothetical protein
LQAERIRDREQLFRSCGIDSISLQAGTPYEKELIAFFKRRKGRQRGA